MTTLHMQPRGRSDGESLLVLLLTATATAVFAYNLLFFAVTV